MSNKCICEQPAFGIDNRHSNKRRTEINIMSGSDGWDIVAWEVNKVVGVFKINYCPECGKKLEDIDK